LTWIEMPLQVKAYDKLLRALKHGNRAEVVFRGYLFGPISFRDLIEKTSTFVPESAGRFGHANQFRTKLVVSEVIEAATAPAIPLPTLNNTNSYEIVAAELPPYLS